MYRRRRRRLNKARFFSFLLLLAAIVTVAVFLLKGNLSWQRGKTVAENTPGQSPAASGSPASTTPHDTPTPEPTPWPTPEPMPDESTDPAVLDVSWMTPAVFDGENAFPEAASFTPDGSIKYWVLENNRPVTEYKPRDIISFPSGSEYSVLEGVTAFRGNHYRDSASYGTRTVTEKKLEIVWTQELGAISAEGSYWPGTGWTGQPLIVRWPETEKRIMNINPEMKAKDLKEVIYPAMDGNIYFLDLETGKPTREKINVGFTMKGTGVVDPRGYPLLYVGMSLNENNTNKTITEFKYMMFSLIDQKLLYSIFGRDPMAFREWGAFDSSAIVDRLTDTLVQVGENGLIYRVKLNTNYNPEAGSIAISPQITKFRYEDSQNPEQGIENSAAFYKNYMYFCDNGGTFMCLDLNTMKPKWTYHVGDDTDTTTVIEETPEGVFLYTANEIDKRSQNNPNSTAPCNIRKFNAITGELIWQRDYECYYQYYINGGSLGTPILGKDDISDLVIFPICFTGSTTDGKMVALDKKTGEEVWSRHLSAYSWSSPVDFLSSDGKTYAIFCDFAGNMHLFDPRTGKDLDVISLGKNIESSPAIYDDMIVVGSYAPKIFGIKIK